MLQGAMRGGIPTGLIINNVGLDWAVKFMEGNGLSNDFRLPKDCDIQSLSSKLSYYMRIQNTTFTEENCRRLSCIRCKEDATHSCDILNNNTIGLADRAFRMLLCDKCLRLVFHESSLQDVVCVVDKPDQRDSLNVEPAETKMGRSN